MKKTVALLFAFILAVSLAACGTGPSDAGLNAQTDGSAADSETTAPAASDTTPDDGAGDGGILIAFFSWSGNTETLAGIIQTETGGDLFAIEPETPYTDDYNALLDQAQQEQADQARPALAARVENWAQYDTIFVGYPIWWGDAPMIVLSFLESYDCSGKTIIPFCTSGGGGFGASVDSVTNSAAGAEILDGFHVSGSGAAHAGEDVAAWIDGLGL